MLRSISEAMEVALLPDRASSYSTKLAHSSGEMHSFEGSVMFRAAIYTVGGYLADTGHYLGPRMPAYETPFSIRDGSFGGGWAIVRYHRALKMFRRFTGEAASDTFKIIRSDHVRHQRSMCNHPLPGAHVYERDKANFTVIFDLIESKMSICKGYLCQGRSEESAI